MSIIHYPFLTRKGGEHWLRLPHWSTKYRVVQIIGMFVITLTAFGCNSDYGRSLPNGYELARTDPNTVVIAAPPDLKRYHPTHCENGIAVGALIDQIAVLEELVIGHVASSPISVLASSERPGWFILDTASDEAMLGLSRDEWESKLREHNIDPVSIQLRPPRSI